MQNKNVVNLPVIPPLAVLNRMVLANMLWDKTTPADLSKAAHACTPPEIADVAIRARTDMNLRTVPLALVRELARHKDRTMYPKIVENTLFQVIQRPDEMMVFLGMYWSNGKVPLAAQVKKGLARAFNKFSKHALAKYQEKDGIKLRDVMHLCHVKPSESEPEKYTQEHRKAKTEKTLSAREEMFKQICEQTLASPDTWEVALSSGGDKKEVFTRLMREESLGGLAFIRNLRNMEEAKVDFQAIAAYSQKVNTARVLPFRFLEASKHLPPKYQPLLESMMLRAVEGMPKLKGRTVLILDVSGSMMSKIGGKSGLSRLDTAYTLAALARELCEDVVIYFTAGDDYKRVHATEPVSSKFRGFELIKEGGRMYARLGGGGIFLAQVMDHVYGLEKDIPADRVIVLTDEQDCDKKCNPDKAITFGVHNYIINVASNSNGIGYGKWTHISGWSEAVLDYIRAFEDFEMDLV